MLYIGIFYLTGLGTSPGAVLVPLHYIYLMLKAAMNNNQDAIEFFKKSGELRQEKAGVPEYLIIFTSKEVIEGKEKPKSLKDEWFNLSEEDYDEMFENSALKRVKYSELKKNLEFIK